jgi:hypothetical protein
MISRVEHEPFILGARNKTGQMAVLSDAMAFALGVMRPAPEPPASEGLPFGLILNSEHTYCPG